MPEKLIGHRDVVLAVRDHLPPVTLLLGPPGVGKWLAARVIAGLHHYPEHDVYQNKSGLKSGNAEDIQRFAQTAGATPAGKLVMACLDESSEAAQAMLLKVLEEPPPGVKFLLTASQPPLPTVVSRCQVLRCGLLTPEQVEQVLVAQGVEARKARTASVICGGSVSGALALADSAEPVLQRVKQALKAASDKSPGEFSRIFRGLPYQEPWADRHHRLLACWAAEAVAGRFMVFKVDDVPQLSRPSAQYMLTMLTSLNGASPRLADRAVLERLAARDDK